MPSQSLSPSVPHSLDLSTKTALRARVADAKNEKNSLSQQDRELLNLESRLLWIPDGKPPDDWTENRSVQVYGELRRRRIKQETVRAALEGLALLRDEGAIPWLEPGEKSAMRVLVNQRVGEEDLFSMAVSRFYQRGAV